METNERAPLLSNKDIVGPVVEAGMKGVGRVHTFLRDEMTVVDVRNFYEAKITSGELMVAKTATKGNGVSPWCCSECNVYLGRIDDPNFCPGCGAKIVEA